MVSDLLKAMEILDGTHSRFLSTNFLGLKNTATLSPNETIAPINPHRLAIWIRPVVYTPYITTGTGQVFVGPATPSGVVIGSIPIITILEDLTDPSLNASFQYIIENLYWHVMTHGHHVQGLWQFVNKTTGLEPTFSVWELVQTIPCPCKED